ncbi:MAG: class I SAM-dependent methyltransferase [Burkholderiales bacterium]
MDEPRDIFAQPRRVTDLRDCYFYHTMELPGHGLVQGQWDLRGRLEDYLGGVQLSGKRVLDLGTASGFLAFSMEQRGAEVVAYDLSEREAWDVVPFAGLDLEALEAKRRAHIRQLNNGFWLSHQALASRVRLVHGSVYAIPREIGAVDVAVLGCILLHLRDPFLALQEACRVAKEAVVVVERPPDLHMLLGGALAALGLPAPSRFFWGTPYVQFLPRDRQRGPNDTWWRLPAATVLEFLAILGFGDARLRYHTERWSGKRRVLYTVVARRTRE